jgi:phosphoribosylformylglycinamidine synthase
VYRQYDHQLFLNTVVGPGHDGTLLRLRDPRTGEETGRGLGLSTDGNHRWCSIDPRVGTAMLVAEAAMNVACVGARPLAVVNCLNFGNPEFPEVMWQLSEAVDGMSEACLALDAPVVGGNVSLYNQSNGTNIDPTPVVGLLGMHEDLSVRPPGLTPDVGDQLLLLGLQPAADVPLGGSRWAWDVRGRRDGRLPTLDLDAVVAVRSLTQQLVTGGSLSGVHDVGDGGLAVALGEFVAVSGHGLVASGVPDHQRLFCESPGRVLVTVSDAGVGVVTAAAEAAGVPVQRLGSIGGDRYIVDDLVDLAAVDLRSSWADRLPNALGQGTVSG